MTGQGSLSRPVYFWWPFSVAAWSLGGEWGPSRSPRCGGGPRLSQKQFTQLEAELAKGPAAHGWEDRRWSLARVKRVIGRRFHLTCTVEGVRKLLVRNGWSCQVPARRAMERDDDVVAGWVKEVWPCAEDSRRPVEPGSSSRRRPVSP
ncbi:winged helix-turn-helix domain-containing protein [Streptomyces sp. NBC_00249]|uniref:helix-turn-helix domain-containing protein n=1 Tax=Streptomyces sp. NBC_00249 TaxID=2975690 RepID=UPI00224C842A|nr:winged helix-turn-helix domain-containing protein [Streptomyces sp. NBC_00249]MCX5195778.1 winged helix-turn-helix domain-containing protein [Streptomyces sp. NBC_00249]